MMKLAVTLPVSSQHEEKKISFMDRPIKGLPTSRRRRNDLQLKELQKKNYSFNRERFRKKWKTYGGSCGQNMCS